MSSQITTNHSLDISSSVYYSYDVVGTSILDIEDKKKITDDHMILDFIRECNRKKRESLTESNVEREENSV